MALLLCIAIPLTASFDGGVKPTWNHGFTYVAGPDTVSCWPILIKEWPGTFTFWYKFYSNQTCSLTVWFEVYNRSTFPDTGTSLLRLDTLFVAPKEAPGDSMLIESWTVQTDPFWREATNWLIPATYMRLVMSTPSNGANDTILYIDSCFLTRGD